MYRNIESHIFRNLNKIIFVQYKNLRAFFWFEFSFDDIQGREESMSDHHYWIFFLRCMISGLTLLDLEFNLKWN